MITLTREEAQQILDAFAWELGGEPLGTEIDKAIKTLRTRLAQPEPEPVAWLHRQGNYTEPHWMQLDDDAKERGWTEEPLYTAPPQREWQGLTDEEIEKLAQWADEHGHGEWHKEFASAIEQALKEKNT